jgi:hypothetical protein
MSRVAIESNLVKPLGPSSRVAAAVLVQLVDTTLGWFISWQIGPGALPEDQVKISIIGTTIVFVLSFAVICAFIGSAIARVLHGRPWTNV